jgi:hypothetical protein
VSEEIELRLEQSFQDERLLGGAHNVAFSRTIAHSLALIESSWGQTWVDNKDMRQWVRGAINRILDIHIGNRLGLLAPEEDRQKEQKNEQMGAYAAEVMERTNAAAEIQKHVLRICELAAEAGLPLPEMATEELISNEKASSGEAA